jgi:hypothetical protein
VTIDPLSPGDRAWFTVYRCPATVVAAYDDGNYWVRFERHGHRFGALAFPRELEPVQPCGHPMSAVRGEGMTHWCSMCEDDND